VPVGGTGTGCLNRTIAGFEGWGYGFGMESTQAIIDAYVQGYKDGWQSVPGSGAAPPVLGFVNHFLIAGKSVYESGYERGREAAAKS